MLLLQHCTIEPCGVPYTPAADAPVITNLSILGQLSSSTATAVSSNPWETIFAVDFLDPAGDLGNGSINFFINGTLLQPESDSLQSGPNAAATLSLTNVFRANQLPLDAQEGRLTFDLLFNAGIADGQVVRLGAQLKDGSTGRLSNCYAMDLRFNVQPVTNSQ